MVFVVVGMGRVGVEDREELEEEGVVVLTHLIWIIAPFHPWQCKDQRNWCSSWSCYSAGQLLLPPPPPHNAAHHVHGCLPAGALQLFSNRDSLCVHRT